MAEQCVGVLSCTTAPDSLNFGGSGYGTSLGEEAVLEAKDAAQDTRWLSKDTGQTGQASISSFL